MFLEDKNKFAVSKDIKSVDALISWLESRHGDESYDFLSTYDCLLCRYVSAVTGGEKGWGAVMRALGSDTSAMFKTVTYGSVGNSQECREYTHTIAAALARARAWKASHEA